MVNTAKNHDDDDDDDDDRVVRVAHAQPTVTRDVTAVDPQVAGRQGAPES